MRVREIIRQVCAEMGVKIINGALSKDHVHMFVEMPPHIAVSDFVRRAKGRSSRKIERWTGGGMPTRSSPLNAHSAFSRPCSAPSATSFFLRNHRAHSQLWL